MQILNRCAIKDFCIPGIILMGKAGLRTVLMIDKELRPVRRERCAVICIGPGHNSGYGLVIGKHLHQRGCKVIFFFLVYPDELKGDAATNLNIIRHLKLPLHVINNARRVQTIPVLFKQIESRGKPCYAVTDVLFGIGLTPDIAGYFAAPILPITFQ
jgi:ADP-dependent NAD(P)H-hydrate dehydratase / NAD(P)H-hydrate epimerase